MRFDLSILIWTGVAKQSDLSLVSFPKDGWCHWFWSCKLWFRVQVDTMLKQTKFNSRYSCDSISKSNEPLVTSWVGFYLFCLHVKFLLFNCSPSPSNECFCHSNWFQTFSRVKGLAEPKTIRRWLYVIFFQDVLRCKRKRGRNLVFTLQNTALRNWYGSEFSKITVAKPRVCLHLIQRRKVRCTPWFFFCFTKLPAGNSRHSWEISYLRLRNFLKAVCRLEFGWAKRWANEGNDVSSWLVGWKPQKIYFPCSCCNRFYVIVHIIEHI